MSRAVACLAVLVSCLMWHCHLAAGRSRGPNVLLIVTDDQGWGDVGFHGNSHLKTPHLDRLARASVELEQFYVCPVCSPTRASLLTGRYNYRTGVVDTYLGRSTMAGDEVTLAEMFVAAGYRTGIFGKWHLGDHYPSRAIDQGFQEALVHGGGGIGQPADPPGNSYFDPVLQHNGEEVKARGYASDIFTDAAMRFISEHSQEPFFAYLAFNCPHTPLQVPREYHERYQSMGLGADTAKVYGMIANIDDNLGRLFAKLEELELQNDTVVIFMTDNGPQQARYNGILNDLKGSVHDGGIRVPCLARWPGKFPAGSKVAQVAAHIDIAPTLLEACGIERPADIAFDGVSLLGLLRGEQVQWPDRMLFFQWHRGDQPERYRACAVRSSRYKLVQPAGRDGLEKFTAAWALYDMSADAGERHNFIDQNAAVAERMKSAYESWFADVSRTRGYPAPRIIVGTKHENPVTLTRQDWRGPRAGWAEDSLGHWEIEAADAGTYDITLRMPPQDSAMVVRLRVGELELKASLAEGAQQAIFKTVPLAAGKNRLEGSVDRATRTVGVHYVDVLWHDPANARR
ncbi:MAG: arylsulfatase [Planctomycetia bacterium]|nr:arylsulfatase [Planctomycetia bacterium]